MIAVIVRTWALVALALLVTSLMLRRPFVIHARPFVWRGHAVTLIVLAMCAAWPLVSLAVLAGLVTFDGDEE